MKSIPSIQRKFLAILLVLLATSASFCWAWVPNTQEQAIAVHLSTDSNQHRPELIFDPILAQVARERAADMAARGYFAHVNPDGVAANYLVSNAGYGLPIVWGTNQQNNYIESIGAGYDLADQVWNAWMNSIDHRTHLLALDSDGFFATETHYGIGYVKVPGSEFVSYWVVITAPPPGIYITSPQSGEKLIADEVNVAGTAPGDSGITSVLVQLKNQNGTATPVLASGTTNWNVTLQGLTKGLNLIRVQGKDINGTLISEATVTIGSIQLSPLVVLTSGSGSVTAAFSGTTSREVGASYSITATPASGILFSGWTGSIQSSSPVLNFVMQEGLALQANFVENPFPSAKGSYTGLMTSGTAGFVKLSLNSRGTFSGKVYLGTIAYGFSGRFSPSGQADVTIKRKGMASLSLHLSLDLDGDQQITGSVTDGLLVSNFVTNLAIFGKTHPSPQAGTYTFAFAPPDSDKSHPIGNGIGTLHINTAGVGVFSGQLADNTHFSCSSAVAKDGSLPLFLLLPGHKGFLAGSLIFEDLADSDATGQILWTKVASSKDLAYPLGFGVLLNATISAYVPPPKGLALTQLAGPAANLEIIDDQGIALIETVASLSQTGAIEFPDTPPSQLKVSTNSKTGLISGSFINPSTNKKCTIRAICLQKQGDVSGYFAGGLKPGAFTVEPITP